MKTRPAALLIVGFVVLTLASGCNGGNDLVGPDDPGRITTPPPGDVTPRPRPTPDPCRQFPSECG